MFRGLVAPFKIICMKLKTEYTILCLEFALIVVGLAIVCFQVIGKYGLFVSLAALANLLAAGLMFCVVYKKQ